MYVGLFIYVQRERCTYVWMQSGEGKLANMPCLTYGIQLCVVSYQIMHRSAYTHIYTLTRVDAHTHTLFFLTTQHQQVTKENSK